MGLFGLGKRIAGLFGAQDKEKILQELEDLLIEADLGSRTAGVLVDGLRRAGGMLSRERAVAAMSDKLRSMVRAHELPVDRDRLNVLLFLGVNGVGKTTTIAKLAAYYNRQFGFSEAVLAAGDTFRAAAVDQLRIHGSRLGLRVVAQGTGADPGAVIFDALESAKANGDRLVFADTAGRMHTKVNLIRELEKIDRIVRGKAADARYLKILVVDATTGQNGLRQAEVFHEAVRLDSVILTKYDSTARGGVVVGICQTLGLPISFVGCGEKTDDLRVFSVDEYIEGLFG